MKSVRCIAFLFIQMHCFAQSVLDSSIFDINYKLNNGIYTSLEELHYNTPKYPDCTLDLDNQRSEISFENLYYITEQHIRKPYKDAIFAIVNEGRLYIFHHNHLNSIFLRGAICTFILKEFIMTSYYPPNSSNPYGDHIGSGASMQRIEVTNIYFFDFKTGLIETVEKEKLDFVIQRDSVLYETFKKIYTDPNNKKTYSYIAQFNARNPLYLFYFREETDFSNE